MANTLFLRLEGPMQSWGERARWSVRDTAPEPTKSGVVGLLACALGWADDERIRDLSRKMRLGVRCDQPGVVIVDYHTVGGGFATPQLLDANGKLKKSNGRPHNEQSWRSYLCDASFLVVVQADDDTIAQLAEATQSPQWTLFLGRKSCPPSRPIFVGVGQFDSLEAALAYENKRSVRGVVECTHSEGVMRRDEVNVRSSRTFLPRYSKDILVSITPVTQETN